MAHRNIDFSKLGGFPFTQNTLDFMQDAYNQAISGLAKMAGNAVIISGMEENSNQVTDGWILYNGELLPFQGGLKQTYFIVTETTESGQFQDDHIYDIYFEKIARFGSGTNQVPYSDLVRLQSIEDLQERIELLEAKGFVPAGVINMWSGAIGSIPEGWALCDGTNGTPDLSGRFVVGYSSSDSDYNAIGKTGGEKRHTLSVSEIPEHDHKTTSDTNVGLENPGSYLSAMGRSGTNSNNYNLTGTNVQPNKYSTSKAGSGNPHENRPPYFVLAYIMKL